MQDHPGAPGTARQESTRTIVSTYDGGTATQPRAPGHERPHAASSGAARHGRLSAASTAPGADIPPATTAGAPGQYCQSAALRAPGHGRPLAITAGESCRDRLSAAPSGTGPDGRPAPAIAPGNLAPHHLSECQHPSTTVHSRPASTAAGNLPHRVFPSVHLPTFPPPTPTHTSPSHSRFRGNPPCPPSNGGTTRESAPPLELAPGEGPGRGQLPTHPTTNQVHPAIQVLPHPRSCSTAATGGLRQHPSRAPPAAMSVIAVQAAIQPHK